MNPLLIASLVSAAFAGAVGYGTASHFCSVKITQMELDNANVRIEIQRAARANTERLTAAVTAAQDEAQRRSAGLMRDADRSRVAADGLRDTSTTAVRTAAESPATCEPITAAYSVVVAESSDFIREVASALDRCLSDNQTLTAAWPK